MRPLITVLCLLLLSGALPGARAEVRLDPAITFLQAEYGKASPTFPGSIRFAEPPGAADFHRLEGLGIEFYDHGAGPLGSRTVYPARIPYSALSPLETVGNLAAVECSWNPGGARPLIVSRPEVQAEQAWQVTSPLGGTLSGAGVTICDFDTGIDYLHPMFFAADGGAFAWMDNNGSGSFDPGDTVDLDGDGLADPDESLAYHEAQFTHTLGNNSLRFDAGWDFLFNDADGDQVIDSGAPGFLEDDPCFGERMFLVDDADGDGRLDPGEVLTSLGTSRVKAVYNTDGSIHRRGIDLLDSERDDWGHGTQVTGILGGGWPGRHHLTGMAPGAQFLHANLSWNDEPPFLVPIEAQLAWAVAEGADVILIEDGEWTWEYLDGSSNLETMISELAADPGIIIVVCAGNLASGHVHSRFSSSVVQGLDCFSVHKILFPSFVWTEPVDLTLDLIIPGGPAVALPLDGTTISHFGYGIYSNYSTSPRGTRRIDLRLATDPEGTWLDNTFHFVFHGPLTEIHGYLDDDTADWNTQARWHTGEEERFTVTSPATADSAISVGAYFISGDGDIDDYSGWGPRIDGFPVVSLAAPGLVVYSANPHHPGDFASFGGTSGAGPHVAGCAALLKELIPSLDHAGCRWYLMAGAGQDQFTGDPDRWGAGKLRIHDAIAFALSSLSDTPLHPDVGLTAYPNPFNARAGLRFDLADAGPFRVRIFDAAGREVWDQALFAAQAGPRDVTWPGCDRQGRPAGSGVYFAHVLQGRTSAACKLTLVR